MFIVVMLQSYKFWQKLAKLIDKLIDSTGPLGAV